MRSATLPTALKSWPARTTIAWQWLHTVAREAPSLNSIAARRSWGTGPARDRGLVIVAARAGDAAHLHALRAEQLGEPLRPGPLRPRAAAVEVEGGVAGSGKV